MKINSKKQEHIIKFHPWSGECNQYPECNIKCFNCHKKLTKQEIKDNMKCCVDCFMD